jgi:hypothetical protein
MVATETLAGLAGVALLGGAGAGLVEFLPAVRDFPRGIRLAHAYLLGIAWTAGWLYALSHWLGVPLRPPAILAVAMAPAIAGAIRLWCRGQHVDGAVVRPRGGGRLAGRLALAVGAAVTIALLCDALTEPLMDYDGRITWSAHARYVRGEGTVDAEALTRRGWWVSTPWYPLLMPLAQVAVLEVTRADVDHHVFRPLYAVFFPVWLLLVHAGARRWAGPRAASYTALAASLLSFPAFAGAGGAASAYSDLPLACFCGAAELLLLAPRLRRSAALTAGILLAAAVLTKAEGEALAVLALVVAGLSPRPRAVIGGRRRCSWCRRRGSLIIAALPVAAALILGHSWRAGIEARFESFERMTSWSLLWPEAITRIPSLTALAGAEMLSFTNWGVFWCAALLVLVAGWRGLRRRTAVPLLVFAAAPLAIGWTYATISLDPSFIVRTTWDRFLLQASVPLFVVLAMALRDVMAPFPKVGHASVASFSRSRRA